MGGQRPQPLWATSFKAWVPSWSESSLCLLTFQLLEMKFYLRDLMLLSYVQPLLFERLADRQTLDPPDVWELRAILQNSLTLLVSKNMVKATALRHISDKVHSHSCRVAKHLCNCSSYTLEGQLLGLATISFNASFAFSAVNSDNKTPLTYRNGKLVHVLPFSKVREWEKFFIFGNEELDSSETFSSLQTAPYRFKCKLAATTSFLS